MCTEAAIKDNVVVVYELLEEMLDNGFPLATESNILKELIKPPTILRTMVNTITGNPHFTGYACDGKHLSSFVFLLNICSLKPWFRAVLSAGSTNVGEQLPTGQLSVVPWRRTGVKYTNNEAYFDVVEEIDVIIDKSGTPVSVKAPQPVLNQSIFKDLYVAPLISFQCSVWIDGTINRKSYYYLELFY